MRQRHVDQRTVGEDALDLAPERRIEPVVVVDVEEAAALQVLAQAHDLGVAEVDVAVPRDVNERVVPQLLVHQRDARFGLVHLERRPLPNRGEQVREARRIGVPVAAAVVLQPGNGERRRERALGRDDRRASARADERYERARARDRREQCARRSPHSKQTATSSSRHSSSSSAPFCSGD